MGVATKAPPCFNLAQNGHFLEHEWSDFTKLLRVDSLTSNRYITALKSIKYHVK